MTISFSVIVVLSSVLTHSSTVASFLLRTSYRGLERCYPIAYTSGDTLLEVKELQRQDCRRQGAQPTETAVPIIVSHCSSIMSSSACLWTAALSLGDCVDWITCHAFVSTIAVLPWSANSPEILTMHGAFVKLLLCATLHSHCLVV